MSCIHLPTYKYLYVNRSNDLRIKELNVFQWVLRRVFGCYAKTHLQNFATRAYPLTFNERFRLSVKKLHQEQPLLTAIKKTNAIYKFDALLHTETLPTGTKVAVRTTFGIADSGQSKTMDSIKFNFIFDNDNSEASLNLEIIKDRVVPMEELMSRSMVKTKPALNILWSEGIGIRYAKKGDSPEAVRAKAKQEKIVYINNFIATLLSNSKEEKFVCDLQNYCVVKTLKQEEKQNLNKAQQECMATLGWKLDPTKEHSDWRRYTYSKPAALPSDSDSDEDARMSLNFHSTLILR